MTQLRDQHMDKDLAEFRDYLVERKYAPGSIDGYVGKVRKYYGERVPNGVRTVFPTSAIYTCTDAKCALERYNEFVIRKEGRATSDTSEVSNGNTSEVSNGNNSEVSEDSEVSEVPVRSRILRPTKITLLRAPKEIIPTVSSDKARAYEMQCVANAALAQLSTELASLRAHSTAQADQIAKLQLQNSALRTNLRTKAQQIRQLSNRVDATPVSTLAFCALIMFALTVLFVWLVPYELECGSIRSMLPSVTKLATSGVNHIFGWHELSV